jgi:integrase
MPFFKRKRLVEITAYDIRSYQNHRRVTCGASTINHECSLLQQMLKRACLWGKIEGDYQPLRLPPPRGRALDDEERRLLLKAGASNANWEMAYLFIIISLNTAAGPNEVATLRLRDVDLEEKTMRVQPEGAKNQFRVRPLPLNEYALNAVKRAWELAQQRGSMLPDHYLFPYQTKRNHYDPTRHVSSSFREAWRQIRSASGITGRVRLYDIRHTAITSLLQNPEVSEETVKSIAGHVSQQILRTYSHIRMDTKREALAGLTEAGAIKEPKKRGPSISNQDVLDMLSAGLGSKIVVEKIRVSPAEFDTSPETLKSLKAAGVPDQVILAMVRA